MKGGIVLFRGAGRSARRYVESDHSLADDYYREDGQAIVKRRITNGIEVLEGELDGESYENWVNWIDPDTGQARGRPRMGRETIDELGNPVVHPASPMFAEININVPKSLSIAAELDEGVSQALDAAQERTARALHDWVTANTGTRVGPKGAQRAVFGQRFESVSVMHRTSRAGDPHRHIHLQFSTRIFAEGAWRALDTAVLFRQQATLRALGEAVINTDEKLSEALARAGFTFDQETGKVVELEQFERAMSKRAQQVERTQTELLNQWLEAHPGQEPGPGVRAAIHQKAWADGRPEKNLGNYPTSEEWKAELESLGYQGPGVAKPSPTPPGQLNDKQLKELAEDVLASLAAGRSTWSVAEVQAAAYTHLIQGRYGVCVDSAGLHEAAEKLTTLAMREAVCLVGSEWERAARATAARAFTSQYVLEAEADLRARLASLAGVGGQSARPDALAAAQANIVLDPSQQEAALAVAGSSGLVVVEGAAGSGKTTMLSAAKAVLETQGRALCVVTPTNKAAAAARGEINAPANSIAKLLHAHGYRWDHLGRWTRLNTGDTDSEGITFNAVPEEYALGAGTTIVIDEAGMVDVDSMRHLLTLASEYKARVVLVGDRAQLPAVGRGGVLEAAIKEAAIRVDMADLHRFREEGWADLTLQLRQRDKAVLKDIIDTGHITLASDEDQLNTNVATKVASHLGAGETAVAVVATNEQAAHLSDLIRTRMIEGGHVSSNELATLADANPASVGDLVQIRTNNRTYGVVNRDLLIVSGQDSYGNIVLTTPDNPGNTMPIRIPAPWLEENATLGYALTAHGVQGETVDHAYIVASDALDGAGLYVGATRGRYTNQIAIQAADETHAHARLGDILTRDRADRGINTAREDATRQLTEMYSHITASSENYRAALERRQALLIDVARATSPQQAATKTDDLAELTRLHQVITAVRMRAGVDSPETISSEISQQTRRIEALAKAWQTNPYTYPATTSPARQDHDHGRDL